ncbi:hypothetical protein HRbin23_01296 [bacterium HR23]|nr:hypothetical protein HRbin23_01296 [bacterium HR23]
MSLAREIGEGFREVVRDLLIPEFRSLQTEVRNLGERLQSLEQRMEARFAQMEERFARVDERFDAMHREILDLTKAVTSINGKLDLLMGQMTE